MQTSLHPSDTRFMKIKVKPSKKQWKHLILEEQLWWLNSSWLTKVYTHFIIYLTHHHHHHLLYAFQDVDDYISLQLSIQPNSNGDTPYRLKKKQWDTHSSPFSKTKNSYNDQCELLWISERITDDKRKLNGVMYKVSVILYILVSLWNVG